ncbi:hypothetical protein KY284_028922 [Solanum tuberosum]|nr:hypothetical protein KY284_028922 [Solanum tuberosum]
MGIEAKYIERWKWSQYDIRNHVCIIACPDELLDVGTEIAENCKGLPLVVDLIAGVIAGREKKKTVWLEVLNNLHSFIFKNEVEVMKVVEISYDHLPDHMKPCLLHFASKSKDSATTIFELKAVWVAEGFVEKTEMKSMEEVVKIYLDVQVLHQIFLPRQITIDDEEHFGLNFDLFGSNKKRHSGKHLYYLRINGDELDNSVSDACHLRHLRLLRVLYLDINVKDSLLNEICMLNHLRFLFIRTQVESMPLSFSNLWNLESLLVNNEGSTLVLLPRVWDLVKLRLLAVSACSFFDMDADESILIAEDILSGFESLCKLETRDFPFGNDKALWSMLQGWRRCYIFGCLLVQ